MNGELVSQRIRGMRNKRDLTFGDLSEQLSEKYGYSVSIQTLKNYETNTGTKADAILGMRIEFIVILADFYGVSCDYLLGRTEDPHVDATVQSVHDFTGLSGKTVEKLNSYPAGSFESNFIKRFFDNLLVDNDMVQNVTEYIKKSAFARHHARREKAFIDAYKKLSSDSTLQLNDKQKKAIEKAEQIGSAFEGLDDGRIAIPAGDAADLFLGYAVGEAQRDIERVVRELCSEISNFNSLLPVDEAKIDSFRWKVDEEET